jgi:HNH endonuclease
MRSNLASYVRGRPLNRISPAGLQPLGVCRILVPGPQSRPERLGPVGVHRGLSSSSQSGRWRLTRTINPMTIPIARLRAAAYVAQRELCYYCQCKMCNGDPSEFARSYGMSIRQVWKIQCTAEHLTARQDGGTNVRSNIAAVCRHCNRLRHARKTPLSADRYRDYVRRRISRGKWARDIRPQDSALNSSIVTVDCRLGNSRCGDPTRRRLPRSGSHHCFWARSPVCSPASRSGAHRGTAEAP